MLTVGKISLIVGVVTVAAAVFLIGAVIVVADLMDQAEQDLGS